MPRVAGIVVGNTGRQRWFDVGDAEIHPGDLVVVQTARGPALGTVRSVPREINQGPQPSTFELLLRAASAEDIDQDERNKERATKALRIAADSIGRLNLPMKVRSAEYCLDGSQITITFSADHRVDFRELVRDLSGRLRTRVLLHQITPRDHTRMLGGCGPCGRELCCGTFLSESGPVSMRMAKDQSLILNPAKFSGACGKLMCCLRFEHETYAEAQRTMPSVGQFVRTPRGDGRVVSRSALNKELTIALNASGAEVVFAMDDIKVPTSFGGCCRQGHGSDDDDAADSNGGIPTMEQAPHCPRARQGVMNTGDAAYDH